MTTEPREKLIERIRKLFAMGNDKSSVHEASIAARRCRAMMDKHGITEADLKTSKFSSIDSGFTFKALPTWLQTLCIGIAKANDCITERGRRTGIVFNGYEQDSLLAKMMLDYLCECMERELKKEVTAGTISGRQESGIFRRQFANVMNVRLTEIATERTKANRSSTGTSLVVMKMSMVSAEFGSARYKKTRSPIRNATQGMVDAAERGAAAAARTGLNTQVSGARTAAVTHK